MSDALGIFFGADDDDLEDTYIPRGLYHWDQANSGSRWAR